MWFIMCVKRPLCLFMFRYKIVEMTSLTLYPLCSYVSKVEAGMLVVMFQVVTCCGRMFGALTVWNCPTCLVAKPTVSATCLHLVDLCVPLVA